VRVLKLGKLPQDELYKAKCFHCQSVVEFSRSEAQTATDRNEYYLKVQCPVCSYPITVAL